MKKTSGTPKFRCTSGSVGGDEGEGYPRRRRPNLYNRLPGRGRVENGSTQSVATVGVLSTYSDAHWRKIAEKTDPRAVKVVEFSGLSVHFVVSTGRGGKMVDKLRVWLLRKLVRKPWFWRALMTKEQEKRMVKIQETFREIREQEFAKAISKTLDDKYLN